MGLHQQPPQWKLWQSFLFLYSLSVAPCLLEAHQILSCRCFGWEICSNRSRTFTTAVSFVAAPIRLTWDICLALTKPDDELFQNHIARRPLPSVLKITPRSSCSRIVSVPLRFETSQPHIRLTSPLKRSKQLYVLHAAQYLPTQVEKKRDYLVQDPKVVTEQRLTN